MEEIVEQHTAGSPVQPGVRWTNRSPADIADELWQDYGCDEGFMLLTTGAETAELVCDAVRRWWHRLGKWRYRSLRLLMLCDCGGGNGYRQHLFKQEVKHLAMRLGLEIRVAHYPPGCSKYNPIERRMLCHVARSLKGVILDSAATAARHISRTSTPAGLSVLTEQARRLYVKGKKATEAFLDAMPIFFDKHLPELNYWATEFDY